MLVDVAIPVPGLGPLTYSHDAAGGVEAGQRVVVPLGTRALAGVVVGPGSLKPAHSGKVKPILRRLDEKPALSREMLDLGKWMAKYYCCSWGEALAVMLPAYLPARKQVLLRLSDKKPGSGPLPALAQDLLARLANGPLPRPALLQGHPEKARAVLRQLRRQGWIVGEKQDAPDSHDGLPAAAGIQPEAPLVLNPRQARALEKITDALGAGSFAGFLLHGVTGSGKTEVYLQAIAHALQRGRGAVLLVPEIALTPQMRSRVQARFGGQVAVLHSGLGPRTRAQAWQRLKGGQAKVALGARSAVFAPVSRLGLMIVDEEHESSYKQEEAPRYHARDIAAVRAKAEKAVLVLGSATPAVETYHNALNGKYTLLSLPARVDGKQLPEVRLVDMSREISPQGGPLIFSEVLLAALEQRLAKKEQSILFLNRRGYAPLVTCPSCSQAVTCPDCSVSLVYHQQQDRLLCHQCGKSMPPRPACPRCGTACVRLTGVGTQRVAAEISRIFPHARVLRMDSDISRQRGALESAWERFGSGQGDVLVGTQMVAKGMDFPNVTLVGIVSADTALHMPDFRAEERTFQIIVQVAGRAGRGGKPGLVLVQTLNMSHPTLSLAQQQEYRLFYEQEEKQRLSLQYPPFARLANVVCLGKDKKRVWNTAQQAADLMRKASSGQDAILGPAPSPRERVAKETRFQILCKSPGHASREKVLHALENIKPLSGVRISVDVDPQSLL
ncbi:primosomal protein N' [candidate division FCPU426 bacterium]|nr:primosomal protein N' [candidate division FCPU426 bacterium]